MRGTHYGNGDPPASIRTHVARGRLDEAMRHEIVLRGRRFVRLANRGAAFSIISRPLADWDTRFALKLKLKPTSLVNPPGKREGALLRSPSGIIEPGACK